MEHKKKRSFHWLRFFSLIFVLYFLLMGGCASTFYVYRPHIEKALAQLLGAESVTLGGLVSVPLVSLRLSRMDVRFSPDLSFGVEDVFLRYQPGALFTEGPMGIVKNLSINKIWIDTRATELSYFVQTMQKKFASKDKTPKTRKPLEKLTDFSLFVNEISMHIIVVAKAYTDVTLSKLSLHTSRRTQLDAQVHLDMDSTLNYHTGINRTKANITASFSNVLKGLGEISLSNSSATFWGMPILEKDDITFRFQPQFLVEVGKEGMLSNAYRQTPASASNPAGYHINLTSPYVIQYQPFQEYGAFDYLLRPGTWKRRLYGDFEGSNMFFGLHLQPTRRSPHFFELDGFKTNEKLYLTLRANTRRGDASANVFFTKESFLPSGTAMITNYEFMRGLSFGAKASAVSFSNGIHIDATDITMNGGQIGDARATFEMFGRGRYRIRTEDPKGPHPDLNAGIHAEFYPGKFDIRLYMYDTPGDFLTKNMGFNIFNLDQNRLSGEVLLYTDRERAFYMDGFANGRFRNRPSLSAKLHYEGSNKLFSVTDIRMPPQRLKGQVHLQFEGTRSNSLIHVNGDAQYRSGPMMPLQGSIFSQLGPQTSQVQITLDESLALQVSNHKPRRFSKIHVQADHFPLSNMGFPGLVNGTVQWDMQHGQLQNTSIHMNYAYNNLKEYLFAMDAQYHASNQQYQVSRFEIGANTAAKHGTGILWRKDDAFLGDIRMGDSEKLAFQYKKGNLFAEIHLQKLLLPNMLGSFQHALVDTKMVVQGPITNPNFAGTLDVKHFESRRQFSLYVKHLQKLGAQFDVHGLQFFYHGFDLKGDASLLVDPKWHPVALSTKGSVKDKNYQSATKFELSYTNTNSTRFMSYLFRNNTFLGVPLGQVQGQITEQTNTFHFLLPKDTLGLNGFLHLSPQATNWNIDMDLDFASINSEGSLANHSIESTHHAQIQLKPFTQLSFLSKAGGSVEVDASVEGSLRNPTVDLDIQGSNFLMQPQILRTRLYPIRNLRIRSTNNRAYIEPTRIHTGGGDFILNGGVTFANGGISQILFALNPADTNVSTPYLDWKPSEGVISVQGRSSIRSFQLAGAPNALNVSGDLALENFGVTLELTSLDLNQETPAWVEGMQFDIRADLRRGNQFFSPIMEFSLDPNGYLAITGSQAQNDLTVVGNMEMNKGNITYLGQSFELDSGSLIFPKEAGNVMPIVSVVGTTTVQDEQGENLDIYLTFRGKFPTISLTGISSVPSRSLAEIYAYLGWGDSSQTSDTANELGIQVLTKSVGTAENLFFSPISRKLRRNTGLDVFNIQTELFQNATENLIYSDEQLSGFALLDGTSIELGKYIYHGLLLHGKLLLATDPYSSSSLTFRYELGLAWEYSFTESGSIILDNKWTPVLDADYNELSTSFSWRQLF